VVVLGAIVATAVVTAWAMSETGMAGPLMSWEAAEEAVEGVWAGTTVPQAAPGTVAPTPAPGSPNAARTVAALPGVPPIVSGAVAPHADRGACTTCHAVSTAQGAPVPSINSNAAMPHVYRGICANCHQITTGPGAMGNAVAGIASVPAPTPGLGAQTTPPPTEAEWNGLEVSDGPQGVVVAAAEGTSALTGVQKGDVVDSVNGQQVRTLSDFVQVTQNGALTQGAMIVQRNGQRLAVELGATGAAAPTPGPFGLPAGGMARAPGSYAQNNPGCTQAGRF
jgi:hypothetical protein